LITPGHRATFFTIGWKAELHPSLMNSIVDSGCEVGNHTSSHKPLKHVSYKQVENELERTDGILEKSVSGTKWFRPPGGCLSWPLFLYLWRRGVKSSPVLWSIWVPDEDRKSEVEILQELAAAAPRSGDIILLHDDHPTIVRALPAVLDLLDQHNLRSVPLSELV